MEGSYHLFTSSKDLVVTDYNQPLFNNLKPITDSLFEDYYFWELREHILETTLLELRAGVDKDLVTILQILTQRFFKHGEVTKVGARSIQRVVEGTTVLPPHIQEDS